MENLQENNGLDAEAELTKLLQEEIAKIWDETPLGYNEDNNAYHIGKGIMINKEKWDEYLAAKEIYSELTPMGFILGEINTAYIQMKENEADDSGESK